MKAKINQKPKIKLQLNPQEGKSGFPDPIKAKCFKCKKSFWIKFVVPQRSYSKKNNWNYWVGKEGKNHKICNFCLRAFYLEDKKVYLSTIKDIKKKNHLRTYVARNII